jgi:hydrogenase maturation protease
MRGDDAAGPELARAVAATGTGIEAIEHEREPSDLIELWRGWDDVVVVDAVAGPRPGRIHRFEVGSDPLPAQFGSRASTHALGLAEIVELGRALGRLPPRLAVIGIEGDRFTAGEPLSPPVEVSVRRLAAEISAPDGAGP